MTVIAFILIGLVVAIRGEPYTPGQGVLWSAALVGLGWYDLQIIKALKKIQRR